MKIQIGPEKTVLLRAAPNSGGKIKLAVLLWLTVQNACNSLLLRYSRVRDVPEMYFSTVAVFWMEIIKLGICLAMAYREQAENGLEGLLKLLRRQILNSPKDTLKVCLPSILYILQNNLLYVAASHLNAATFMLKIFSTAIFSILLLNRSILRAQWFSLFVLFVGVSLVQFQPAANDGDDKGKGQLDGEEAEEGQSALKGLVAICIACTLSGFSGVYFEKILKDSTAISLWMRNIQMAVFAVPASLVAAFFQDGAKIAEHGWMYGWDWVVWLTAAWVALGGLSVAVCIKYASNIAKNFATSVAILLATLGSIQFFHFRPSGQFSVGALLVIASIFLYSSAASFARCCNCLLYGRSREAERGGGQHSSGLSYNKKKMEEGTKSRMFG